RMRLESGRVFGTLLLPATLGGLMAMAAPVAVGLARQGRGAARFLALAGATLALVALVLSRSYGALSAGAIAALWATGRLPRRRAMVLRAGVLVLALILAGLFASARQRSSGQQLLEPQGPILQRWLNWKTAAAITARYPVLGAGPGAYASAFVNARQPGENDTRYAHSTPLQAVAEMGLWVLLPLGGGLWLLRRRLVKALKGSPVEAGAAVGLMSFVAHNLVDFTAYLPSTLWAALALAVALPGGAAAKGVAAELSSADASAPSARLRAALLVGLAAACVMALWPAARQWKAEQLREQARLAARAKAGVSEAHRLYGQAVRSDPLRAELRLEYAAFLLASGPERAGEALHEARAAARADRGSAYARVLSATALAARREWAEAYVEAAAATRIHPHSKQARSALEGLEAYLDAAAP
ncbi:MAG: O-antigen ligase family protein, partial [Acidobacteriota bacterium]